MQSQSQCYFFKKATTKKDTIICYQVGDHWMQYMYFFVAARSQHVQIQAVPPTVKYLENDLVIICSITNPLSLIAIISLELQRNESGSFQTIVSINQDQKPHWINTLLERRATVSGSVNDTNSTELKFSIDKKMCCAQKILLCTNVKCQDIIIQSALIISCMMKIKLPSHIQVWIIWTFNMNDE